VITFGTVVMIANNCRIKLFLRPASSLFGYSQRVFTPAAPDTHPVMVLSLLI